MARMPVLFVGHGSPLTLEQPHRFAEWRRWGEQLPTPKALLVISAHWETQPLMIGAVQTLPLIYDFYGFPPAYYQLQYAAPGAPALAARVRELVAQQQIPVADRPDRGWDHGVWIPLLGLYPQADIPLLQLSMPGHDADALMALGRALAPLREEGVLIIASGLVTHNLRQWTEDGVVAPWASAFDSWLAAALERDDRTALRQWATAPGARDSVPTPDHLVPLFVALGAATPQEPVSFPVTGFEFGSFSHRSVQWGTGE
ncbi:dioxygenase [Pseudaeromonas sharmana]|uniref:Dioxygenase n=1 Tax=Pseudaeromonas sharmana TaxID=328412 RepID=A0ABV8CKF5_9GAMM